MEWKVCEIGCPRDVQSLERWFRQVSKTFWKQNQQNPCAGVDFGVRMWPKNLPKISISFFSFSKVSSLTFKIFSKNQVHFLSISCTIIDARTRVLLIRASNGLPDLPKPFPQRLYIPRTTDLTKFSLDFAKEKKTFFKAHVLVSAENLSCGYLRREMNKMCSFRRVPKTISFL